jgi:hypothetical protein
MSIEEIIILLLGGAMVLSSSIASMKLFLKRKSKLLAFFSLSWFSIALYLILAALSDVFKFPLLFKINDSLIIPSALVFFLMFLDYAQHDSISPKKTALSVFFFTAILTWNWYPSNVVSYVGGNLVVPFYDIYVTIQNFYIVILSISIAYWQLLTAKKAPDSFKKVKVFLRIGAVLSIVSAISAALSFVPEAYAVMLFSIVGIALTSTIAIQKEPRIVHILPFVVYRLIITSKGGCLYYAKEWSKVDVDNVMIAGMMSAINTFSKGALKDKDAGMSMDDLTSHERFDAGVISEIKLQKAVMLAEMKYAPVNVLLLSSKASEDLRASMEGFSQSFVQSFKEDLYTKDGFPIEVRIASVASTFEESRIEGIVSKYFSNIPSFN